MFSAGLVCGQFCIQSWGPMMSPPLPFYISLSLYPSPQIYFRCLSLGRLGHRLYNWPCVGTRRRPSHEYPIFFNISNMIICVCVCINPGVTVWLIWFFKRGPVESKQNFITDICYIGIRIYLLFSLSDKWNYNSI